MRREICININRLTTNSGNVDFGIIPFIFKTIYGTLSKKMVECYICVILDQASANKGPIWKFKFVDFMHGSVSQRVFWSVLLKTTFYILDRRQQKLKVVAGWILFICPRLAYYSSFWATVPIFLRATLVVNPVKLKQTEFAESIWISSRFGPITRSGYNFPQSKSGKRWQIFLRAYLFRHKLHFCR